MIAHALRFTVSRTRRAYVPPATHWASSDTSASLPPMGMRVRLKASYAILAGTSTESRAILQALKDTRYNKTAAAKKLGITFRALRYKLKKLGID